MIQKSVAFPQHGDWKLELSQSIRSLTDLFDYCEIDHDPMQYRQIQDFPLRVTRFYASLIEKGNLDDPLLKQVLPSSAEFQQQPGYDLDAVGDRQALAAPGLIHKYASRVLLTLTGACAIHCRYCFRRHFPYAGNNPDIDPDGPALRYLKTDPSIREVILSGGDPLMLSNARLSRLVENLNQLPHVRLLRIHSRLISVLPERLDDSLGEILSGFHGIVTLVSHINHGNEIHPHNQAAFRRLHSMGVRLFNQSVLLKGINDHASTLSQLSYRLYDSGITPYYLHRLDKVEGAAHFDISESCSCRIYTQLRNSLPGYLVPQLVEEIPGHAAKSPVQCDQIKLSSDKTE